MFDNCTEGFTSVLKRSYLAIFAIADIAGGKPVKRMSVTEMVKSKSIASLLQYHSELRTMILRH